MTPFLAGAGNKILMFSPYHTLFRGNVPKDVEKGIAALPAGANQTL